MHCVVVRLPAPGWMSTTRNLCQPTTPLRTFDNVVLLPHLGYVSRNNYRGLYGGAVANIRAWLDGNVINEVTPVTKP